MGFLVLDELCYIYDEKARSCLHALKPGTVPCKKRTVSFTKRTLQCNKRATHGLIDQCCRSKKTD